MPTNENFTVTFSEAISAEQLANVGLKIDGVVTYPDVSSSTASWGSGSSSWNCQKPAEPVATLSFTKATGGSPTIQEVSYRNE